MQHGLSSIPEWLPSPPQGSRPEPDRRLTENQNSILNSSQPRIPRQTSGSPNAVSCAPPPGGSSASIANAATVSIVSPDVESHSSYESTNRRKRKAEESLKLGTLAAAKLHNPVDALNLLVLAADRTETRKNEEAVPSDRRHSREGGKATIMGSNEARGAQWPRATSASVSSPLYTLADFPLVQRKIINEMELSYFINLFFSKIHHIFPIVPYKRIPTNEAELIAFARGIVAYLLVYWLSL